MLAVVAAGLAEATLAFGQVGRISDDAGVRHAVVTLTPKLTATPVPTPAPTVTPTVAPTPVPTAVAPHAVTNSFVHLRQSNSTSSAILMDLNGGTIVTLLPYSDSQWQQVQYNGLTGYIFRSYLMY